MKIESIIKRSQWTLKFRKFHAFLMLIIVLTSSCSYFQEAEQYSVLDITDFGIKPGTGENAIYAVQEAIEKAKSIDGEVLIKFPVGRYDFRADSSHVKTYFESNTTDNNPKNLAFLIEKCQYLIIDGGGSDFVFHGPMQPFSIDNSENITIKNVNIDWDIPLTAQAEVVSATNKIIELKIDTNQFPYIIEDGWLYFIDKTWKEPMWKWGTMEFDVTTRLVVSETGDKGCIRAVDNKFYFEERKPGIVQMLGEFTRVPAVGNFLVLRHSPRDHAGIFVWHSENIHLENINVYHAAGLGCLSQYSRDLNYVNVNFIPNQKKNRFLSAHDDGFQVSNCAGQVNIIDCEFAGLMDDPINVHGTSVRIIEILDEHKLKCLFVHKQSEGMLWGRPGEQIAFLENESMQTVFTGRLKSFNAINTSEFIVEFENAVPKEITAGDALENLSWTPDLHISNCLFGSCRARSLLVTTPGKVVIENNVFESSGSAILIAGDANYWYESGAVNDVIIRNNTFNDPCLTSMYQFCEAIISIYPEIPKLNIETLFHRNIVIENNVFYPFDYPVLYAKSVDNIDFINNKIIRSKRFKAFHKRKYSLSFEACKDVEVSGNTFEGDVLGKNILLENMSENEISAQKEFQLSCNSKPNIVLILVDDLGWKDLHAYGSNYYQTPNIDKLAESGMTFTNAYASASNCAPSRACLHSGLYTPRHGIYTVNSSERGKTKLRKLIPTPNETVLHDSIITIAEKLKIADYVTISIGKWHLGDDPCTQGFDLNVGGTHLGHPTSYFSPYKNEALKDGDDGEYLTDRLTNEAIRFIEQNKEQKFFLYLPYFTVHTPLQAKKDLIEKYDKSDGDESQNNPVFAAMIETMDKNVGRIIASLDSLKLSENTLLIFTSDNGGVARISSQQPLRYGKGSYYEGGIRVPLIVSWPGKINPNSKNDVPVSNIDFYPTLLEVTGIVESISTKLDGKSLMPLLLGKNEFDSLRPIFWHFPIYLQSTNDQFKDGRDMYFRTRPGSVIRSGNWKLHEYFEDGAIELYNLQDDPGEQDNLAEKYPEIVKQLYQLLDEWRMGTNAPIPRELNPYYDGVTNTK